MNLDDNTTAHRILAVILTKGRMTLPQFAAELSIGYDTVNSANRRLVREGMTYKSRHRTYGITSLGRYWADKWCVLEPEYKHCAHCRVKRMKTSFRLKSKAKGYRAAKCKLCEGIELRIAHHRKMLDRAEAEWKTVREEGSP